MIKAVFIDIDNTIYSFDEYTKQAMREGFAHFGLRKYEDWMFDVFTRINDEMWLALERGETNFEELHKVRWGRVFDELSIDFDGWEFELYFREHILESTIEEKGAGDVVRYLSKKYVLCAASNGPMEQQRHRLTVGGLVDCFYQVYISSDIGASKPSKEFFEECFVRLNENRADKIQPCECMMIGDSLTSDMAGAKAYGMPTLFYNRKKRSVFSSDVDYVVDELSEIKNIL